MKRAYCKKALAIAIIGTGLALSNQTFADGCQRAKDKIERVFGTKSNACANIKTTADLNKNPFMYRNPDSNGCDLGLKLPGLPNFGSIGGADLCGIAKTVTGETVSQVNGALSKQTEDAVNKANQTSRDSAGVNIFGGEMDIGGAIQDKVITK